MGRYCSPCGRGRLLCTLYLHAYLHSCSPPLALTTALLSWQSRCRQESIHPNSLATRPSRAPTFLPRNRRSHVQPQLDVWGHGATTSPTIPSALYVCRVPTFTSHALLEETAHALTIRLPNSQLPMAKGMMPARKPT